MAVAREQVRAARYELAAYPQQYRDSHRAIIAVSERRGAALPIRSKKMTKRMQGCSHPPKRFGRKPSKVHPQFDDFRIDSCCPDRLSDATVLAHSFHPAKTGGSLLASTSKSQAIARNPLVFTKFSSLSDGPSGRFSPRSHLLTASLRTLR